MKGKYIVPDIEVVGIEAEDVLTMSGTGSMNSGSGNSGFSRIFQSKSDIV